jgi:hypothetical protein
MEVDCVHCGFRANWMFGRGRTFYLIVSNDEMVRGCPIVRARTAPENEAAGYRCRWLDASLENYANLCLGGS